MNGLFENKRVFLIGGPGGVGKTTVAASLGIALAQKGYKTIVLTVDPAKRLAQALGFDNFERDIQKVPLPSPSQGELFASMLDSQRYFDRIIERFAKNPEQCNKILNNPIYRIGTENLGGTHEYAAMERLLEFSNNHEYEKIIIDTPPSQNAVELFKAPQRLSSFMDSSVLKWFTGSRPGFVKLFHRSTRLAMKLFERLFGSDFLTSFGNFLEDLHGMHEGFKNRNLEVIQLLQSELTSFLLVTYPSEIRYHECVSFLGTLQERGIPLQAIIFNKTEQSIQPEDLKSSSILEYYQKIYDIQRCWMREFSNYLPHTPIIELPRLPQEPHQLADLSQIGEKLLR